MSLITEKMHIIQENIAAAARASGRKRGDITLLAATKMNGYDAVREAIAAGVDAVGENRVDELLEKDALGAYSGVPLHFIGHLQRNKAKLIAGRCELIHSVDSIELMRLLGRLSAALGVTQQVLVEINIGAEVSKSGIAPEKLDSFLYNCAGIENVSVAGLMCIPPAGLERDENRRFFSDMRELYVDISTKKYDNVDMRLLSMGMSADYADAVREGANIVRVGSAIFGQRHYR